MGGRESASASVLRSSSAPSELLNVRVRRPAFRSGALVASPAFEEFSLGVKDALPGNEVRDCPGDAPDVSCVATPGAITRDPPFLLHEDCHVIERDGYLLYRLERVDVSARLSLAFGSRIHEPDDPVFSVLAVGKKDVLVLGLRMDIAGVASQGVAESGLVLFPVCRLHNKGGFSRSSSPSINVKSG